MSKVALIKRPPERRVWILSILGVGAIWLSLHALGLHEFFFVIDDADLVLAPPLQTGFSLAALLSLFTPGNHIDFYPLRDLTYWFDIWFWNIHSSADAFGLRLQNFAWLLSSSVLVFLVLEHTTRKVTLAGVLAVLWLVHPIHSEFLMWGSARKDLIATTLTLASVLFVIKQRPGMGLLFWVMGLLGKSTYGLLPFVLLWGLPKGDSRRRWVWAGCVVSVINAALQSTIYRVYNDMRFDYETLNRIQGSAAALGRMVLGWFWNPLNAVDVENWGSWVSRNSQWIPVGVFVWLGFASIGLWVLKHRGRLSAFGFLGLSAVLIYLPISALIFPHRNFYSVRYAEPLFTVVVLALGLVLSQATLRSRVVMVLFAMTSLGIGVASVSEAKNWERSVLVFRKALRIDPDNPSLLRLLENELLNLRRWGRLTASEDQEISEIRARLATLCLTPQALARPDGLCFGHWLSRKSDDGLDAEVFRAPEPAIAYLREVNPKSADRWTLRLQFAEAIRGRGAPPLRSPEEQWVHSTQRLDHWFWLCIVKGPDQAAHQYAEWERARLVSARFFSDYVVGLRRLKTLSLEVRRQLDACVDIKKPRPSMKEDRG